MQNCQKLQNCQEPGSIKAPKRVTTFKYKAGASTARRETTPRHLHQGHAERGPCRLGGAEQARGTQVPIDSRTRTRRNQHTRTRGTRVLSARRGRTVPRDTRPLRLERPSGPRHNHLDATTRRENPHSDSEATTRLGQRKFGLVRTTTPAADRVASSPPLSLLLAEREDVFGFGLGNI